MIKKNKPSLSYINCNLNRSPSKEAHSFGKAQRFIEKKRFSPDRFYDLPDGFNKRGAGIGFGNKVDIILKQLNDPAMYNLKSQFGDLDNLSIMNVKPERRQQLKKNNSFILLRQPTDVSFNNRQSCEKKPSKKLRHSPFKGQDKLKRQQNQRTKSYTQYQNNQNKKQRKSAHQMKYQCTQRNINNKSKTSYMDFLLPKSSEKNRKVKNKEEFSYSQNKSTHYDRVKPKEPLQQSTNKAEKTRFKEESRSRVGTSSYNNFSQFGEKVRYI